MFFREFLRYRRTVYLDSNATTKISPNVVKRMTYVLKNNYGNPSSLYKAAIYSQIIIDDSRRFLANSIGALPEEIIFTGSASEANNMVLKSLSELATPQKNKIISTLVEHASGITTLEFLKQKGFEISYVPIDNKGRINCEELSKRIDDKTFLVFFILANNEIGTIQNYQQIVQIARNHAVYVMADCVQALGKIPLNMKKMDFDYASFSAHKIYGPKGIGALYVKKGNPISPLIHGGHQESELRAGTESIHNIAGFGEACKALPELLEKGIQYKQLKDYFLEQLKLIKPDIQINSPEENCLPNTVNISFPGVNNAYFIATLDYYGIAVSAGSACNTQSNDPSHVLTAIGLTDEMARETLRFSFDSSVTKKKIDYALSIMRDFLHHKLPPVGIIEPKQLDEAMLGDPNVFILDVRFYHDRLFLKGLPGCTEIPFFTFQKYLKFIPFNKKIIVVCQGGYNAPIVAYTMKSKGYNDVGFLMLGMLGWKKANPELYEKLAGKDCKKL